LLDEPLSNLDARLRLTMREELRKIQQEINITTIFVTHDQEDAMSISDLIVVMRSGVIEQIGKPQEVYDDPANLFVAMFLGSPQINVFTGKLEGGDLYIGGDIALSAVDAPDQDVYVGVRPEGFIVDREGGLACSLGHVEVMGRDVSIVSAHPASRAASVRSIVDAGAASGFDGENVRFSLKRNKVHIFSRETEERIPF